MFKPCISQCQKCPKGTKSLITTKRFLCPTHLQEYKDSQKSPQKLLLEETKRKEKIEKKKAYKPKPRKITNEKSVFDRIWETRLHNCEVCGRPIIRKKNSVGMFSHVLSKGASTHSRLDEDYILLMGDGLYPNCDHHKTWENRTSNMRDIEMWKPIFLLLDSAKEKAHNSRKNKPLYTE